MGAGDRTVSAVPIRTGDIARWRADRGPAALGCGPLSARFPSGGGRRCIVLIMHISVSTYAPLGRDGRLCL